MKAIRETVRNKIMLQSGREGREIPILVDDDGDLDANDLEEEEEEEDDEDNDNEDDIEAGENADNMDVDFEVENEDDVLDIDVDTLPKDEIGKRVASKVCYIILLHILMILKITIGGPAYEKSSIFQ